MKEIGKRSINLYAMRYEVEINPGILPLISGHKYVCRTSTSIGNVYSYGYTYKGCIRNSDKLLKKLHKKYE